MVRMALDSDQGDPTSVQRVSQSNRADATAVIKSWADRLGTALQNARAGAKAPKS